MDRRAPCGCDVMSLMDTVVEQANEEIASGLSIVTLRDFKAAARSLKAAELAFRDAQQVYAEAVKRLSEEAVK